MLYALKQQLNHLAETEGESFAAAIRKRLGSRPSAKEVQSLKNMVLVMPEMIAQVRVWNNAPAIDASLKRLHGFLLTYLYEPADFLSTEKHGLFGYLDDAYVVASVYARTMAHLDETTQRALSKSTDLPKQVPEWIQMARQVLPAETRKIDQMLEEIIGGRTDLFDRMMSQAHSQKSGA